MRVLVIGGGLAGSLLAWRLAQQPDTAIEVRTGRTGADATGASGGAVRAYDTLPEQRELAIASLVELLGSQVLRAWASYRETGFAYLRRSAAAPGQDAALAAELAEIERALPGSAEVTSPAEAFGASGGQGVSVGGADGPGWTDRPGDDEAAEVDRGPMRQVATVGQIQAQDRVAGLDNRHVGRGIGLRARMRLHIRMIGAEELPGAIARQVFDHVRVFATAIVALARITLGILVGKNRAYRFKHGFAHEILRGDHLQPFMLAVNLTIDGRGNLRVSVLEPAFYSVGHI